MKNLVFIAMCKSDILKYDQRQKVGPFSCLIKKSKKVTLKESSTLEAFCNVQWTFWLFFSANIIFLPSSYLYVQSQQWKQQKKYVKYVQS